MLTKPVDGSKSKDGKADEIPIPEIRKVSSYEQDYRANFVKPSVYLRSPAFGAPMSEIVEYDLDNDDEDWLTQYNDGQNRLPAEKLELMIWKLEIACGEATEHWMAESAATATEKGQIISYQDRCTQMASTAALPKEKALALLSDVSGRPALLEAVYKYWTEKRLKTGKPCLRRLQPPPAPGDSNPFNVFRQREKTNRPQTRRRRENDGASYDKMRAIRRQMEMVYAVVELQLRREEKKLEAAKCECDSHALQIKLRHEPRTVHEEIEAEFAKKPSAKPLTPKELEWDPQRPVALPLSQAEVVVGHDGAYRLGGERFAPKQDTHAGGKHGKKRRRDDAMAAAMPGKGYDPRMMSALGGGFGQHGMPPGYALGPDGRLLTDPAVLARNRSRPIVPIVVDPYQPPPEIPDIEMIFAMTPGGESIGAVRVAAGDAQAALQAADRAGRSDRVRSQGSADPAAVLQPGGGVAHGPGRGLWGREHAREDAEDDSSVMTARGCSRGVRPGGLEKTIIYKLRRCGAFTARRASTPARRFISKPKHLEDQKHLVTTTETILVNDVSRVDPRLTASIGDTCRRPRDLVFSRPPRRRCRLPCPRSTWRTSRACPRPTCPSPRRPCRPSCRPVCRRPSVDRRIDRGFCRAVRRRLCHPRVLCRKARRAAYRRSRRRRARGPARRRACHRTRRRGRVDRPRVDRACRRGRTRRCARPCRIDCYNRPVLRGRRRAACTGRRGSYEVAD